eukprot:TRINITY_DN23021_c0_g1_i1.p1 TRINITY_DN23021_c0_g1~~TRINITY_DN23021_c0_g1_i1.p1  ORF type:complete len:409 (+),score=-96.87 TRINITY_DN23021_c0_g1_i1:1401-2627(+)
MTLYLDYMASTPVRPEVAEAMYACLTSPESFGNPASGWHIYGQNAKATVHKAASQVAKLIGASPKEIIWTSGATEANNLALKGCAEFYNRKGKHIVTMQSEHASVRAVCQFLETQGYTVTYLQPNQDGLLDLDRLKESLRSDTILVSVMHANSETGVLQDIAKISAIAHSVGALFHTDAAQSVGKVAIDVRAMGIDLLSFSAHKLYGPKGIGALFVSQKPRIRLTPQIHGGDQQHRVRSGTLPVAQIVGFGEACAWLQEDIPKRQEALWEKRKGFLSRLTEKIPGLHFHGNSKQCLPHCLNFFVEGVDFEMLLAQIAPKLAVSVGSACNGVALYPSAVLLAMGVERRRAIASIRISFSEYTSHQDLDYTVEVLAEVISELRAHPLGSLWKLSAQKSLDKINALSAEEP